MLVAALLAWSDPSGVADALARADWALVALGVVAYGLFFLLRGVRWALLLGRGNAGAGTATLLTAAGWVVSTFVPLKAGDVLRAAWMARRHGVPLGASAGTVALERALDVIGLAVASSIALLAIHRSGAEVPAILADVVAIAWLLPLAGLALLATLAHLVPPARRTNRILRFAGHVLDQLPALARRPRVLIPVAAVTCMAIAAQSLVYAFLILAFLPGASTLAVLAGAPLFLLSFGLALTPGHLGTYEAAFVLIYAALGVGTPSTLVPVAVALHLTTASIVSVLGGVSFGLLWALARPPPTTAADGPRGHATRPAATNREARP